MTTPAIVRRRPAGSKPTSRERRRGQAAPATNTEHHRRDAPGVNVPPVRSALDSLFDAPELLLIQIEIAAGTGDRRRAWRRRDSAGTAPLASQDQPCWRSQGRLAPRHSSAARARRARRRGSLSRLMARARGPDARASSHCRALPTPLRPPPAPPSLRCCPAATRGCGTSAVLRFCKQLAVVQGQAEREQRERAIRIQPVGFLERVHRRRHIADRHQPHA